MRPAPLMLCIVAVGCGRLGFDPAPPPAAQQISYGCVDPGAPTGFDNLGTGACEPWGSSMFINATLSEINSELVITPSTTTGPESYAGCFQHGTLQFVAALAEVTQVLDSTAAPDAYTLFQVFGADIQTSAGMVVEHGNLGYYDLGANAQVASAPYDPASMRWWRIRPFDGAIISEVSPDGNAWTTFGTFDTTPPSTITINLGAGTNAFDPAPTSAHIASVNVCPR